MKNIFTAEKIAHFFSLFSSAKRIAILSHTNPDGDAIGSTLALHRALCAHKEYTQKDIRVITPNRMPAFLQFMDTNRTVESFGDNEKECTAFLAAADLIILMDFNDTSRLDKMSGAIDSNISAPRVLIDHHIAPPQYDLAFHSTNSSSTGLLTYLLIESANMELTAEIATPLYTAMMTDTGGFMFGNLNKELYGALSEIAATGINIVEINRAVFNNQSENKVRMMGYLLSNKTVVDHKHRGAYITLTLKEKERFNHQIGDTEGVVNIPLTIKGIEFSALIIENKDHLKVSLRSIGDIDVNTICREYFNGGGHKNAAGGKFLGSIDECVEVIQEIMDRL